MHHHKVVDIRLNSAILDVPGTIGSGQATACNIRYDPGTRKLRANRLFPNGSNKQQKDRSRTLSTKKLLSYLNNNSTMNSSNVHKQNDTSESLKALLSGVAQSHSLLNQRRRSPSSNIGRDSGRKGIKRLPSALLGRSLSLANNLLVIKHQSSSPPMLDPFTKKRSLNMSLKEKFVCLSKQKISSNIKGGFPQPSRFSIEGETSPSKRRTVSKRGSSGVICYASNNQNLRLIDQKMTEVKLRLQGFFSEYRKLKKYNVAMKRADSTEPLDIPANGLQL